MIVAVAVMGMMQAALDQIIYMVAMRHRRMSAVGPVDVVRWMPLGCLCANVWMHFIHRNHVFIHMIAMRVMQMAIMQIVRVPFVFNRQVAAARPVLVGMVFMFNAFAHKEPFIPSSLILPARRRKKRFCKPLALAERIAPNGADRTRAMTAHDTFQGRIARFHRQSALPPQSR